MSVPHSTFAIISRYSGEVLHEQKFPVLLEARWRPVAEGIFEDRPASPKKGGQAAPSVSAAPIRAAGYVPPHVRSSGGEPLLDALPPAPGCSLLSLAALQKII